MFFLKKNYEGKSFAPHSLNKRGVYKWKKKVTNAKAYSPGIKSPKRFAPAKTQSLASYFIPSRITKEGESLF
jgi:hypothetical protein